MNEVTNTENPNVKIVEINGVKMEVDLRHAKQISNFKVGSRVKVLAKEYSEAKVFHGVIIGFDAFDNLPTINVMYFARSYGGAEIKMVSVNADTKDVEIVADHDTEVPVEKAYINKTLDSEILEAERKIEDLKRKKEFFNEMYLKFMPNDENKTIAGGK